MTGSDNGHAGVRRLHEPAHDGEIDDAGREVGGRIEVGVLRMAERVGMERRDDRETVDGPLREHPVIGRG